MKAEKAANRISAADVIGAIEDGIAETNRLVSVSDLERSLGIGARRVIDQLIQNKELAVLYEGRSVPRVIAPRYMFDEALRQQRRPPWMKEFVLPGHRELDDAIERDRSIAAKLDQLERLLYATGEALEESVGAALSELGFEEVQVTHDSNDCDVRFRSDGLLFLAEAKGKTGQIDKDDVLQLQGWVAQEVEKGIEPDLLRGVVIGNQQRSVHPGQRGAPVTAAAERFAKLHGFGVWATSEIYSLVLAVLKSQDVGAEQLNARRVLTARDYFKRRI